MHHTCQFSGLNPSSAMFPWGFHVLPVPVSGFPAAVSDVFSLMAPFHWHTGADPYPSHTPRETSSSTVPDHFCLQLQRSSLGKDVAEFGKWQWRKTEETLIYYSHCVHHYFNDLISASKSFTTAVFCQHQMLAELVFTSISLHYESIPFNSFKLF